MLFISLKNDGCIELTSIDELSNEKTKLKFDNKEQWKEFLRLKPGLNTTWSKFVEKFNLKENENC